MLRGKAMGYEMLVFCHGYVSNHCLFNCWEQEVSYIALWGTNESVSELFLSLPCQYKELFSSLCPTVRLISKLMVSVAKISARLKRSKINTDFIIPFTNQNHYFEITWYFQHLQVLLQHGADPMKKSKYGDDILQTACIKVKMIELAAIQILLWTQMFYKFRDMSHT